MKKGERLMKIIGDADDKFVDEAAQKQKKRGFKMWVAGGGLCAAALAGVMALNGVFGSPRGVSDVISGITSEAETGGALNIPETADAPAETEKADTPSQPFEPFDEPNPYDTDARRASNGLISEITATDTDGGCVKTNTSFLIKSTRDVETDEIERRLKLPEGKEFELTKLSECEYRLSPREILEEGEVVKLGALGKYGDVMDSWAFQTTESFKVRSTYPEDGSRKVYNDTGIEIEFTTPPSPDNIADYFEISPPIETMLSVHGNTLYILPLGSELDNDTPYTVTLKKGLKAAYSGELTEDYSFSFRTSKNERDSYMFTYNGFSETFIKGDNIVIEIKQSGDLKDKDVQLDLYRYKNADDYYEDIRAYAENSAEEADLSGLDLVYSHADKALPNSNDYYPSFLLLPEDLEEGWYIADITCADINCRYMLEINPISVYSLALGEENVFFVNDAETGKAAEGAEISLTLGGKTYTGTVDKDGLCDIVTDGGDEKYGVVDIKYKNYRFIDVYNSTRDDEIIYNDLFYMYLYTDREAYLPTDTINVWGAVIPRRDGAVIPHELYLGFEGSETEGERVKVTPDEHGTFRASFSYKNHTTSYYTRVYLYDGTNDMSEMYSKGVYIEEYVKPTYVITPEVPEYVIMPQLDAVKVGVDASFYEGTPASGLAMEISCGNTAPAVLTDNTGHASAELLDEDSDSWMLGSMGVRFTVSGVEAEYSSVHSYIPAFYRDVMCNAEYDKDSHTLTVELNSMDFSKIENFLNQSKHPYDPYDYDVLKGAPYDTEITVKIKRVWSEKTVTGSYYDYLEKRTVTTYDYNYREENFGTYTVNSENGKSLLDLTLDKEGSYHVEINYKDSRGGLTKEYLYNITNNYLPYSDMNRVYYAFEYGDEPTYYITWAYDMMYNFDENEVIRLKLKGKNAEPSDNGRIFFAANQNDFIELSVHEGKEVSYKPPLSALPSFLTSGAYFDGRHVYPINGLFFKFDPSERAAELTITPDKASYDAGDEISVTVDVKDKDGKPLPGAAVALSLVDEAAFAIMNQKVTLLSSLYYPIYYPYATSRCSYIQHVYGGEDFEGGKGGGDGEPQARRDFKDNAFFDRGITDENGTARFSFKLPDNLTTWRATALAVKEMETGRLYAGNNTCPVVTTRPLFITPIMLKEYVSGDDIAFSAKCVGLDEGGVVTCTVTGKDTDKTLSAEPGRTVNFGKLPTGEYKALFTAENGGNSDAVEMPFTVVDSILETPVRNSFDLSEGVKINPKKYPVTMAFYDKEYMFCTDILRKLSDYYGDRLDMTVAAAYADIKLGYYPDDYSLAERFMGETRYGLAKLMENSEEDIKLTAKLAAALPEIINRSAAVEYCEDLLNSQNVTASDMSACYLILAALGEPVLEDIKAALKETDFDWTYEMRMIAALALCGDYNTAYVRYLELVPEITYETREDGEYAYIDSGESSQIRTTAALMAASLLKLKEADMFARWLYNEEPMYDSFALELVIYLENYVPKTDGDAEFTYNLNGETKTVKLDRHRPNIMSFGEQQFINAGFKVTSGEVYTEVNYIGRPDEQDTEPSVTVTKTITGGTKPGDLALVNITVDSSVKGFFRIDDVIPSCGRYTESDYGYASEVNGQKVTLYINTKYNRNARYSFRITTEGEYVLESAVAQGDNGWGMSERTTIAVSE